MILLLTMNFLFPQFLFGLAVLAIPIVVHLFNFRKTQKIYFSSIRFLTAANLVSKAKRKIKHLLILLCRMLALTFLVLAFAQPVQNNQDSAGQSNELVIFIDNSYSISNELLNGQYGLDEALSLAESIIQAYPKGSKVKLLTNDFDAYANRSKSLKQVSDKLTEVKYAPKARSANEVLSRIKQIHGSNSAVDIFWIGDFQASTFGQLEVGLDSSNQVYLLPLNFAKTSNVYIDSAYIESPLITEADNVVLHVVLKNGGAEEVKEMPLKLFQSGVQVSNSTVNIEGNSSEKINIDIPINKATRANYKIEIEDFPVTFDDEHYFVLDAAKKIKVAVVNGINGNSKINAVFGNNAIFDFKSFSEQNISYDVLESSDYVVINEVDNISISLQNVLRNYIGNNGVLTIIPSENADVDSYNTAFPFLKLSKMDTSRYVALKPPNVQDPFFEQVFERADKNLALPKSKKMWSWSPIARNLLTQQDGAAFLSFFKYPGSVYVLGVPMKDAYTDLHKNALFVPVVYKMAMSNLKSNGPLSFKLSENRAILRNVYYNKEDVLKLKSEQLEVIPVVIKGQDGLMLEIDSKELKSGFYDLTDGTDIVTTIAFNLDNEESILAQKPIEAVVESFQKQGMQVEHFTESDMQNLQETLKEKYLGVPLWKYAILMTLLFFALEIVIIRFVK